MTPAELCGGPTTCATCNQPARLDLEQFGRYFCSARCRNRATRQRLRPALGQPVALQRPRCPGCGERLSAEASDLPFCSSRCRTRQRQQAAQVRQHGSGTDQLIAAHAALHQRSNHGD